VDNNPFLARPVPEKKAPNRLPVILAAVCVLLAGGLVAWLEFGPKPVVQQAPLTEEAKAYIGNLALSDVTMSAKLNYFSQKAVEIQGKITNHGDRILNVVEVTCVFRDYSNQVVARERLAIVSQRMGGLKPGETKAFRLPFDNAPEAWNQQMPQLVIASIDFS
jgi:hypothetical protein